MAENTKIEWCDHTVNFWWGCTKVSPACANCYAEGLDRHFHPSIVSEVRFQGEPVTALHWGYRAPRMLRVGSAIKEAWRYNARAMKQGRRFRVFANSMADFFEDRRDLDSARAEALDTMLSTSHLDWIILTKRPEKIPDLLRVASKHHRLATILPAWIDGIISPPENIWLGTTVEDQAHAAPRIVALRQVPAAVRFLSCEPLLGSVDLSGEYLAEACGGSYPFPGLEAKHRTQLIDTMDWVICGGESGPHARPMHPNWPRGLRDQCAAAGVPFFFKQWGEYEDTGKHGPRAGDLVVWPDGETRKLVAGEWAASLDAATMRRVGKVRAGRLLDGQEHHGFPRV